VLHRVHDRAHVDAFVQRVADRSLSIRALSRVWKSSAMPSCTNRRDPAQQTCPWLNQMASTRPSIALSMSASSKTM
jgi:hypothetical protein